MKKKTYAIIVIGLLCLAYLGYNYIYQDHRDIASEKAAYRLTAQDILNEFSQNATQAQIKYLNKTIVVNGQVTSMDSGALTINSRIFCTMLDSLQMVSEKPNNPVSVKGRFIGYDELLEELKLDQCTIIN